MQTFSVQFKNNVEFGTWGSRRGPRGPSSGFKMPPKLLKVFRICDARMSSGCIILHLDKNFREYPQTPAVPQIIQSLDSEDKLSRLMLG